MKETFTFNCSPDCELIFGVSLPPMRDLLLLFLLLLLLLFPFINNSYHQSIRNLDIIFMIILIYEGHSIIYEKIEKRIHKCKLYTVCKKYFNLSKNICFESIQNGGKSNRLLHSRTEVCHQILGG